MKMTIAILGALALAACDTSGGEAIPCATATDCPSGQVCAKTQGTPGAAARPGHVETEDGSISFVTREPAKGDGAAPAKDGVCTTPPSGLGALGDTSGSGGLGGLAGACMDIAGVWEVTGGACFPQGELGTVTQSGCALTITSDAAAISNATLSGTTLGFTVTVTASRGVAKYACATTLTSASVAAGQCTVDIDGSTCAVALGRKP